VIARESVDCKQIDHIVNHIVFSRHVRPTPEFGWYDNEENAWEITVGDGLIRGFTTMDNFDMRHFLAEIGVPADAITWDEDSLERRRIDGEN